MFEASHRPGRTHAAGAVLLLVGTAACSSSHHAAAPLVVPSTASVASQHTTVPAPCALLTTAQVSQALHVTVLDGQPSDLPAPLAGQGCLWTANTQPVRDFILNVRTDASISASGFGVASLFAKTQQTLGQEQKFIQLKGVGDAAIVGQTFASVAAGDVKLDGDVRAGTVAQNRAALRTLMAEAAANLH